MPGNDMARDDLPQHRRRMRGAVSVSAAALLTLGGCLTPTEYSRQADDEVRRIFEQKWAEQFGPRDSFTPVPVPAATATPQPRAIRSPLSLARAVALATAANRDCQRRKEELYTTALALTLARHEFARQWFAGLDATYERDEEVRTIDARGAIGFTQTLADGTQIALDVASTWTHFLLGDPNMTLLSAINASVTIPLMRGRGREIAQEQLTQAERDTLYAIREFSRFRKAFVVSIVTDYYGVLQALDRVENDALNHKSLLANLARVKLMADTGRVPQFQASEVRQSALQAKDRWNQSRESYKARLDEFKIRLALPTDADVTLDPKELDVLASAPVAMPAVTPATAVGTALACRLDLANTRDRVRDAERQLVVAADALKAQVDLVGSADVASTPPARLGRLRFGRGAYLLGLQIDLPLDRKAQRNAYRRAEIALTDSKRMLAEETDEVKLEVRQAHRDLGEAHTSYQIQLESLKLARQRVDMQQILLQEGRATSRNYLDAQDDLLTAQNARTAALVALTLARLRFHRDVGTLQVRPDGQWEEPADPPAPRVPPPPTTRPAHGTQNQSTPPATDTTP